MLEPPPSRVASPCASCWPLMRPPTRIPLTPFFLASQGNPAFPQLREATVASTRPRSTIMYTTMRQYAAVTPTTFDTLISRKSDIETLIREVPGFVQYDLVRT